LEKMPQSIFNQTPAVQDVSTRPSIYIGELEGQLDEPSMFNTEEKQFNCAASGSPSVSDLEEKGKPYEVKIDPLKVTKQMLLTCKVMRRRNNNVPPLGSIRGKSVSHQRDSLFGPGGRSINYNTLTTGNSQLETSRFNETSIHYTDPRMEAFRDQIRSMNKQPINTSRTAG
jgi:hypothetical protein